ncbi:hypothetical protein BD626DRAFT_61337 [Schizophyllum amplum]|uniref:Uncharacterized protein n=1 Tax=Schizophyllum amplum TaxID=97359 RepID=A0A550CCA1_9AGAR|nr:hypothetical protein BD626DRAFT_61337 [Auriculariopsis ampla]
MPDLPPWPQHWLFTFAPRFASSPLNSRMYDRTLTHRHATASHHPSRDRRPAHSHAHNAEWSFDPRRRAPGATHAWERRRPRPDHTQQQQQQQGEPQRPPAERAAPGFYQPFGNSATRQSAYSHRMESVERELNRVQRVSSVGRAVQVTVVVGVALYLLSYANVSNDAPDGFERVMNEENWAKDDSDPP